jgi:hypothetical protein
MKTANINDYFIYEGKVVKVVTISHQQKVLWLRPIDNTGPDIVVVESDDDFQKKIQPITTISES